MSLTGVFSYAVARIEPNPKAQEAVGTVTNKREVTLPSGECSFWALVSWSQVGMCFSDFPREMVECNGYEADSGGFPPGIRRQSFETEKVTYLFVHQFPHL